MREFQKNAQRVIKMGWLLATIMIVLCSKTQAMLPKGCDIEDVKTETVQVKTKTNSLVYIQNTQAADLFLASDNVQLTVKLVPLQWSVFLPAHTENTVFTCIESKPGSEQRVSCKGLVKICRLSDVEFAGAFESKQWLVSNESLENSYDLLTLKHIKVA